MVIWLALVIPIVVAFVLQLGFRHRIVWWELVLPFGVSLVLVGSSKLIISNAMTTSTEYLTTYAVRAEYWEDWSELVVRTRVVSNGKTSRTETYTEVVHHPAEWYAVDPTGRSHSISSTHFEELSKRWKERVFKTALHSGCVIKSGGVYLSSWPKTDETMEVLSFTHSYENRVKAAPSVFHHRRIDKEERLQLGLFDYPSIHSHQQQMVLGVDDPQSDRLLSIWNAKYGATHQIRIWLLIFVNQPMEAAIAQESYWNGGNKNELVLCVGVDSSQTVEWAYVFSWTEKEMFKAECRTVIEDQIGHRLDSTKIINSTAGLVPTGWERKQFKDFNYLSVEPPIWAVVLVYVLTLTVSVGCGVWAIMNDFNPTT